jgi:hypothetical protein
MELFIIVSSNLLENENRLIKMVDTTSLNVAKRIALRATKKLVSHSEFINDTSFVLKIVDKHFNVILYYEWVTGSDVLDTNENNFVNN